MQIEDKSKETAILFHLQPHTEGPNSPNTNPSNHTQEAKRDVLVLCRHTQRTLTFL